MEIEFEDEEIGDEFEKLRRSVKHIWNENFDLKAELNRKEKDCCNLLDERDDLTRENIELKTALEMCIDRLKMGLNENVSDEVLRLVNYNNPQ